jgi:hypothetical protein
MKQLTQAENKYPYKAAPMTLGNMRTNGVPTLAAWCLGQVKRLYQNSETLTHVTRRCAGMIAS